VKYQEGENSCIGLCEEREAFTGFGRTGVSTACDEEKLFGRREKCGFLFPGNLIFCRMAIYVSFVNTHIGHKAIEIKVSSI
jgi:hypothetical protein